MNSADPSQRTIQALQERLARLTEASLLINASLDLDEVLRQVAENARVLTGARYAFIVSVDADGPPREFVYSGITEEDFQRMNAWPDAMPAFYGRPVPVDGRGRAWVRRHREAGEATVYDVFDGSGALAMTVEAGVGRRVVSFGEGKLYAVRMDEYGLQVLERHALP